MVLCITWFDNGCSDTSSSWSIDCDAVAVSVVCGDNLLFSSYCVWFARFFSGVGVIHARRKSLGDTMDDDATEFEKSVWVTTVDIKTAFL